jgi:hypothetical protein
MTQEALKRVAEKLRRTGASIPAPEVTGTIEGSVVTGLCIALALVEAEIEALAQPEQEPVAVKRMKEWVEFLKRQSDNGQHMNIPSSFGAGTSWELAIELEQFINTHPPQRTEQEPTCPECKAVVLYECVACSSNNYPPKETT